jgi:hypothetical protein
MMARKPPAEPAYAAPPSHGPHPEGAAEVQLARIRSLRLTVARKEALARKNYNEASQLRDRAARHPNWDRADAENEQARMLLAEAEKLDEDITQLHDEIEALAAKIPDEDLLYL